MVLGEQTHIDQPRAFKLSSNHEKLIPNVTLNLSVCHVYVMVSHIFQGAKQQGRLENIKTKWGELCPKRWQALDVGGRWRHVSMKQIRFGQ